MTNVSLALSLNNAKLARHSHRLGKGKVDPVLN
jgi:hypothetical protein